MQLDKEDYAQLEKAADLFFAVLKKHGAEGQQEIFDILDEIATRRIDELERGTRCQ